MATIPILVVVLAILPVSTFLLSSFAYAETNINKPYFTKYLSKVRKGPSSSKRHIITLKKCAQIKVVREAKNKGWFLIERLNGKKLGSYGFDNNTSSAYITNSVSDISRMNDLFGALWHKRYNSKALDSKKVINKISSTAEHALALTLSSLRNLSESHDSVKKGNWDYTKFIGRQIDFLVVGIIGFGRLGKLYSRYMRAFNCKIIVYDPYKKINNKYVQKVNNLSYLFKNSDIISIHVHLRKETKNLLNEKSFSFMKKNVLIVNTSRGDIVNENELIRFLKKNKKAKYATDVLSNEINSRKNHSLVKLSKKNQQLLITPHIGGMTKEAQEIAFNHAVKKMKYYLKKIKNEKNFKLNK